MGVRATANPEQWYTTGEACLQAGSQGLSLNRERLVRLCLEGQIRAVLVRGRYLIDPASLKQFLRQASGELAQAGAAR